jgi:5-hydroxyisourate hydrolase
MISTNVLDLTRGQPAARMPVELDVFVTGHGWVEVGRGITTDTGEIEDFGEPEAQGLYRLMFDVASYMPHAFFPSIAVTFEIREPGDRFYLPLLLNQFGYTAYRGL